MLNSRDIDLLRPDERWLPIEGYDGEYYISDYGRVISAKRKGYNVLRSFTDKYGYVTINLRKGGKLKQCFVHRLVASAFLSNPYNKPCINHIDENKQNNHISNLQWCTVAENNLYGSHVLAVAQKLYIPVVQAEKTGKPIMDYLSMSHASEATGIDRSSICKCCKGKLAFAGGFLWKYLEVV